MLDINKRVLCLTSSLSSEGGRKTNDTVNY